MKMDYFSGSFKFISFVMEEWMLLSGLTLIFLIYFHYTSTFDHFKKRGIPYMKPTIFLGNLGSRLMQKESFILFQKKVYDYFKGCPYGGIFEGRRPVLFLLDHDLIKAVTIRDFDHFMDRNSFNSREPRFLSRSLLNLKGHEWKAVRSILTPTFNSSRLRNMLPLMQKCSSQMVDLLNSQDGKEVEMKDMMGNLTLEVIGVCAFGIKCDAISDQNAHFAQVAKKFNQMSKYKRMLVFMLLLFMPQMIRLLRFSFLNIEACEELVQLLVATKEQRRKSDAKRNDFLQILIDAAEKEKNEHGDKNIQLDDDTIDAQALLFLFAGYETSSTLLSFAVHTLATKPELQDKLRANIMDKIEGEEITYELLAEMTYLEAFLLETLRIYPPVGRIDRVCTKKYNLPNTNITMNPGEVLAISVYGLHMDPEIYPEPEVFKPERFMGDEKASRASHLFMSFGAGPRNCIGLRFAMISTKLIMVYLLKHFNFTPCSKTIEPVRFSKREFLLKAEHGLWVKVNSINRD